MNNIKSAAYLNSGFKIRMDQLLRMNHSGEIKGLVLFREVYISEAGIKWMAPFVYQAEGRTVYEAFKIQKDPIFKVIVRLWRIYGPDLLILTEYRNGKIRVCKTVDPHNRLDCREMDGKGDVVL